MSRFLTSPGWNFRVEIDGDDLVVENATATWFGGNNDPHDNGLTASGIPTRNNPHVMGCALPVCWYSKSTADSPFITQRKIRKPSIPWRTKVSVESQKTGKIVEVALIDNGPAKSANDAIDLTVAAFQSLGFSLKQGVIKVSFRILGAAKYMEAEG